MEHFLEQNGAACKVCQTEQTYPRHFQAQKPKEGMLKSDRLACSEPNFDLHQWLSNLQKNVTRLSDVTVAFQQCV